MFSSDYDLFSTTSRPHGATPANPHDPTTLPESEHVSEPSSNVSRPLSINQKHMNFNALKRAHTQRVVPELKEEDLEESFVRGA